MLGDPTQVLFLTYSGNSVTGVSSLLLSFLFSRLQLLKQHSCLAASPPLSSCSESLTEVLQHLSLTTVIEMTVLLTRTGLSSPAVTQPRQSEWGL